VFNIVFHQSGSFFFVESENPKGSASQYQPFSVFPEDHPVQYLFYLSRLLLRDMTFPPQVARALFDVAFF